MTDDAPITTTKQPALQLLHEGDILRALEGADARPHRYVFNAAAGKALAYLSGGLAFVAAAVAVWKGVEATLWFTVCAVLGGLALGLAAYGLRWWNFARKNFVVLTDEHLYVGRTGRAWRIGWELLDRDALGFERMQVGSARAELDVQVAGESIPIHLSHPLASLEDIEAFTLRLLENLKEHEHED